MDKKKVWENYKSPQMDVIEIEVEQGFADSKNTEDFGDWNN